MSTTDWKDHTYAEIYDNCLAALEKRKENGGDFTIDDAKRVLQGLYVSEGSDWLGRGELGDTIMGAQIAAHEAFIHAWEAELKRGN